uniref:Pre-mRNA-splicing factor SLU7 n=1 Tax=Biomphalaria glabrata TaxID=6526 RepID=A0A2C9K0F1_BIOGL
GGESDGDEKYYAEEMDMPGQKFETKQRITVRNLRIREDTAKYLYNLDPNSAYYDPKTRSMRENPLKNTSKEDITELKFGGDNFVRSSGDAQEMAKRQLFAWEAFERGNDIHLQADPTKLELMHKEFEKRKDEFKKTAKDSILDQYGGQEHLESLPKQLLLAQTEDYIEYSRTGSVIKGQEKAAVKSRYEEDVYNNNHKSVWGSFWREGRWGYACCHSYIKESYCTGEAGKKAEEECSLLVPSQHQATFQETKEATQVKNNAKKKNKKKKQKKKKMTKKNDDSSSTESSSSSSSSSESDSSISSSEEDEESQKKRLLKEALKAQKEHDKKMTQLLQIDERKRSYNSICDIKAPTDEEMEAFRLKMRRVDDPMANFLTD